MVADQYRALALLVREIAALGAESLEYRPNLVVASKLANAVAGMVGGLATDEGGRANIQQEANRLTTLAARWAAATSEEGAKKIDTPENLRELADEFTKDADQLIRQAGLAGTDLDRAIKRPEGPVALRPVS